MSPALLSLRDLRFRWPGALQDVVAIERLDLAAGATLFLRGPSGCGKSTLLSLIAGVLLPTQGEVRLLGTDWRSLSGHRRDRQRADHVGYVFQQFNLLPYLSVLDNVLLPCRFSALRAERARAPDGAPIRSAAEGLLRALDLPAALWRQPAAALSVGQQQRVAAARALIGKPALVIADEPTSALDEDLRAVFMDLLLDACRQAGSALIFVSHDARLAKHFQHQLDLPSLQLKQGPAS